MKKEDVIKGTCTLQVPRGKQKVIAERVELAPVSVRRALIGEKENLSPDNYEKIRRMAVEEYDAVSIKVQKVAM